MTSSARHVVSLTAVLAGSEFKLRYAGSALGAFWSAAKPLALFGVLYFAFSDVFAAGVVTFRRAADRAAEYV